MPPQDIHQPSPNRPPEADSAIPAKPETTAAGSVPPDTSTPVPISTGAPAAGPPITEQKTVEPASNETKPVEEKTWRDVAPDYLVTVVDWLLFFRRHPFVAILLAIVTVIGLSLEGPFKKILQTKEKHIAIFLLMEKEVPKNKDLHEINSKDVAILAKSKWKGGKDWETSGESYTYIKGTDLGTFIFDDHYTTLKNFTESFDISIDQYSSPAVISWIPRIQPKWSLPLLRSSPWRDKYYLMLLTIWPQIGADGHTVTTTATLRMFRTDGTATREWSRPIFEFFPTDTQCKLAVTVFTKVHEHNNVHHEADETDFNVSFVKTRASPNPESLCNEDAGTERDADGYYDSDARRLTSGTIGFAMPYESDRERIANIFINKNDDAEDEKTDVKTEDKK